MIRKLTRLKVLWVFIKPYKFYVPLLVGLALVVGILEMLLVGVFYPLLRDGLGQEPANAGFVISFIYDLLDIIPTDDILSAASITIIVLAVLIFLSRLVYIRLSVQTAAKITIQNKERVFNKYRESDYQFYVDNRQGDLIYKASQAPDSISGALDAILKVIVEVILLVSVFILLISLSWKGSAVVVMGGVAYFYFIRYLMVKVSYIAGRGMLQAHQNENVVLNEYITGVKQISVSGVASRWSEQFSEAVKTRWRFWVKETFWNLATPRILDMLFFLSAGGIVLALSIRYSDEKLVSMVSMLGTFLLAVFRLLPKVQVVGTQWLRVANLLPNLEAVRNLLKDSTYSKVQSGERPFSTLESGIEFKDVNFNHKGRESTLIDVSLYIQKDRVTAIAGPSGSGKSTLVDLLLRLYDVDTGNIYLDGIDIREYDLSMFLTKVGFVGQETFIYNASVKDNITFGRKYTMDEVIEAAKLANAHEFIAQLPHGYDTVIGDRGMRLSGGEKQRVAIARAMIRKPEILILDEATSSLDNVSEKVVQEAIDRASQNCTTLTIAHRLSTIKNADMIYVLDKGRIVEAGTHDELVSKYGKYWELYSSNGKE